MRAQKRPELIARPTGRAGFGGDAEGTPVADVTAGSSPDAPYPTAETETQVSERIGYQLKGSSIVAMFEHGARANRLAHYSDDELAATFTEVGRITLTPFEQSVLDDVRAEIARRTALAQAGGDADAGKDEGAR